MPSNSIFEPQYTHLLRTRAYLRSLPDGLASYPECVSKGQVWKNILRFTDTHKMRNQVPPDIAIVPDSSVLAGAWIPMTQSFAGHLALRDCLFETDDQICEHFRALDKQLFSGPAYRVLFMLASPMMAVHGAERSFASMFKGLTLRATSTQPKTVDLQLDYPPQLLPSLVGRLFLVAFEVALELAGAKAVAGRVLEHGPVLAKYRLSWH